MSTTEATGLTDVPSRVKNWSPESRIVLAGRILETRERPHRPARRRQEPMGKKGGT
jgi:hypothetical protein